MTGKTTDGRSAGDGISIRGRSQVGSGAAGRGGVGGGTGGAREAPPLAAAGLVSRRSLSTREGDATAAWAPCR